MNITVRKIKTDSDSVIGAVFTTNIPNSANEKVISDIENRIINYAFDNYFKNESLSIFKSIYRDMISVAFIRNLNELEQETIQI